MKEEKRILNVLGQVEENYIEEASSSKRANKKPDWIKWTSIVACFVVLFVVTLSFLKNDTKPLIPIEDDLPPAITQTPNNVIPPTDINPNGLHLVQLSYVTQTTPEISTDFIIHINSKSYASCEENGTYIIQPRTPMSEGIPECDLQIYRVADIPPATLAESIREKLTETHLNVGDITDHTVVDGLFLHADNGNTWDAEQVDVTITDDLLGGSYVLTARYFTEATEGHGVIFADMVGTFKVVTSANVATMPAYLTELYRTISLFAPVFFSNDTSEMSDILAQDVQIYTYDTDVTDDVSIASIDYSISGHENPTAAIVSIKHRVNTEDSYNYLTIELTYTANGKWIINFAGIEK